MKLIFGTTNKRKVEDLQNIINEMNLDIEVISMEDIGWDRGEIDENGSSNKSCVTIKNLSNFKAEWLYEIKKDRRNPVFLFSI